MLGIEAACREGCGQQQGHRSQAAAWATHLFCIQAWPSGRLGGCGEQSAWRLEGRRGSAWQAERDEAKVLQLLSISSVNTCFRIVFDRATASATHTSSP